MFRSKSLVAINEPHSMVTECYKMFRTNLHYMNVDTPNQVLLFTSSFTEEGKTTSVVNTAITYAQAEQKVLVIECDLRKARIHNLFALQSSPGLTNALADGIALSDVVQKLEELPNLHVLTSGALPPNPAELLASKKMQELIEAARKHYDIIIIDTPPVLSVTDAISLTRLADGVVICVATHVTKTDELKKAKKALEQVGTKVLGVLMTKADVKHKKYYAYYGDDKKKWRFGKNK